MLTIFYTKDFFISYINIAELIAAFKDSAFPYIGILTNVSDPFISSSFTPFASFPIIKATLSL